MSLTLKSNATTSSRSMTDFGIEFRLRVATWQRKSQIRPCPRRRIAPQANQGGET